MLNTDNLEAANERETRFSDPRVKQIWDQDRMGCIPCLFTQSFLG